MGTKPSGSQQKRFALDESIEYILGGKKVQIENLVAGVNPVIEAYKLGLVKRLFIRAGEIRHDVLSLAERVSKVVELNKDEFDRNLDFGGHQQCAAEIFPLPHPGIEEAVQAPGLALVVLLDGVTDPRNAGAIVRTAAAAGASAVILPQHNSAQPGPVFYKASAGMAFRVPLCRRLNLSQAIDTLVRMDFWSVASSSWGPPEGRQRAVPFWEFKFPERCALVLGSEGKGIRDKLEGKCDFRIYVPMAEEVDSLNVSVAAGIIMYAWRFQALGGAYGLPPDYPDSTRQSTPRR